MRGLVRLLVMFGPLIFRQVKKMQRNKERQAPRQSRPAETFRRDRNPADKFETKTTKPKQSRKYNRADKMEDATVDEQAKSYNPDDMVAPAGEKKGWSIKDIFFKD